MLVENDMWNGVQISPLTETVHSTPVIGSALYMQR